MLREFQNKTLEEIKWKVIGTLGKLFIDLLFCTTRVESVGFEKIKGIAESKKVIAACWHSRILLVSYLYKGWNASILVSRSKDGEIIARILEKQAGIVATEFECYWCQVVGRNSHYVFTNRNAAGEINFSDTRV